MRFSLLSLGFLSVLVGCAHLERTSVEQKIDEQMNQVKDYYADTGETIFKDYPEREENAPLTILATSDVNPESYERIAELRMESWRGWSEFAARARELGGDAMTSPVKRKNIQVSQVFKKKARVALQTRGKN